MTNTVIHINPTKPSELEFDVSIKDVNPTSTPVVRFVISSEACDYSFKCNESKDVKSKWCVSLPMLPQLTGDTAPFCVEVIVGDYYSEPVKGIVELMADPEPKVKNKDKDTPKPSVTVSVKVNQTDVEKDKPREDSIKENAGQGGGGEITGMYAPTNALLKPERDPTENGRMKGDSSVNDEFVDKDRLSLDKAEDMSSSITPGGGAPAYQQEDGKPRNGKIVPPGEAEGESDTEAEHEDEEFDPKVVADKIVRDMVGKATKPAKRGSLFSRDSDGKAVIKGLETPETKQRLKNNASKVKNILGAT